MVLYTLHILYMVSSPHRPARGLALSWQLTERGGRFVRTAKTAPRREGLVEGGA